MPLLSEVARASVLQHAWAEFWGTFLFLTSVNMLVAARVGVLAASLAAGFSTYAWTVAFNAMSEAAFNWAVSLAVLLGVTLAPDGAVRLPAGGRAEVAAQFAANVVAEFAAAVAAAGVTRAFFDDGGDVLLPAITDTGRAFAIEALMVALLSALFTWTIFVIRRGGDKPFVVPAYQRAFLFGLFVAAASLIAAGTSGAVLSPNRHLGLAIVYGRWARWWVYVWGDLLGGLVGGLLALLWVWTLQDAAPSTQMATRRQGRFPSTRL